MMFVFCGILIKVSAKCKC